MSVVDIDFEGTGANNNDSASEQNLNDPTKNNSSQEDVTNLNGGGDEDITGKDGNTSTSSQTDDSNAGENTDDSNPSTGELNVGDQIEVDGKTYTVSDKGDLVDDKGNVFKEAKDIPEWLKSVTVEDGTEEQITIDSIQEALGVTITDDKGNPVTFSNNSDGIRSYVDSVISLKSNELQTAAINRLYADNPLLKEFQDYVQLTGSPKGFGDIPDRSGITLDKNNEHQLISVIKLAAREFGNKSLNDNYIKYLKDSGGLYDEAASQLQALVDKDKAYRKEIETKAAEQRAKEAENTKAYWESVHNTINGGIIAGYTIPETFTKEVDGKKTIINRSDFFDYVSKAVEKDENGRSITGYQKDLNALTDEEYRSKELLDAWLMFTGGTYKDLIDMAVKEDAVRKLRVKSKESRSTKSVKVIKQQTGKATIDDIVF